MHRPSQPHRLSFGALLTFRREQADEELHVRLMLLHRKPQGAVREALGILCMAFSHRVHAFCCATGPNCSGPDFQPQSYASATYTVADVHHANHTQLLSIRGGLLLCTTQPIDCFS